MAKLISIYWRDIPSQVIARQGRKNAKVQLSERFQVSIDKAAMRAGRQGSTQYLDDWRRVYQECGGELEKEAQLEAERFEKDYSDERLKQLAKSNGLDPEKTEGEV